MIDLLNKRVRILATSAAMALLMAGAPQALADTPADTLVLGFAFDDIISLDPAEAFELSTAEVTANTYTKLVALNPSDTSKVVGELADSWTISDDGLTYTFKLKPDLKFASGSPTPPAADASTFERPVQHDKSPALLP